MSNKPAALLTPVLNNAALNLAKIELLQQHFPQVLEVDAKGNYVVNAAKLQLALDPAGVKVEEDGYELRWAGKREAYHTAFTPAQTVLNPLPAESKDWDSTGNVLMRGDNLDALRLLRHSYHGEVKLIYIDPPYNTQSDAFIYRDDFSVNQSQVLEQLGYDKDNIEYIKNIYGAKTHSGWLSFMYPRLLLAKDLLRDDGVIFISIDDNEQAQLKLLCDEVFGEQNWIGNIVWKNVTDNNPTQIAIEHENIVCYAREKPEKGTAWKSNISAVKDKLVQLGLDYVAKYKDLTTLQNEYSIWLKENRNQLSPLDRYKYIDFGGIYTGSQSVHNPGREGYRYDILHPVSGKPCKEPLMGYRFPLETMQELIKNEKILFGDDEQKIIELKVYAHEYEEKLSSLITLDGRVGAYELRNHFPEIKKMFDNPKASDLITQLASFTTDKNDLILDFFAGSGTTGEAVMRLNAEDGGTRQFILVQIPQPIDAKKQKEAHQFVTQTLNKPATIFEITAERLRRAGAAIAAKQAADQAAASAKAGGLLTADHNAAATPVDTGFRVFDIVPDTDALILQKPLATATQDDLSFYTDGSAQQTAQTSETSSPVNTDSQNTNAPASPQGLAQDKTQHVLHNLLLSEGLPLTTQIKEILPSAVYLAHDVALIVAPVELDVLSDALTALRQAGTPAQHLTVYAPWMRSDNFMQGIKTLAESLGYSADKLRLRG